MTNIISFGCLLVIKVARLTKKIKRNLYEHFYINNRAASSDYFQYQLVRQFFLTVVWSKEYQNLIYTNTKKTANLRGWNQLIFGIFPYK